MSKDDKLKTIRKTSREQTPLRAGRGAGFHSSKAYDRSEEDERWRRFVWQEGDNDVEHTLPRESEIDQ